jgi:Protein of unknown function DUF262
MANYQPRSYSVSDFWEWHKQGSLVLQPRFQRREVWSPKAQSYLIDTIIKDLPIPLIFIRQSIDANDKKSVREVVDGQQRIRAILKYIEDTFILSRTHNKELGGKRFSQLPEEIQNQILAYELPIALLSGVSDADVLRIFSRINSYTLTLNAQEKINAEFFGTFKRVVYEIGVTHLEFWRSNNILTDKAITRMAEAELASELVVAMIADLQEGKKTLKSFYKKYDEEFPDERRIVKEFESIINLIGDIFQGRVAQTIFSRTPIFYSLFCALYDAKYGMAGKSPKLPQQSFPSSKLPIFYQELLGFSDEVSKDDPSGIYRKFKATMAGKTSVLPERKIRHEILLGVLSKVS